MIVAGVLARAQTPEFLPEIDAYLKVNAVTRVYFQAKGDRDEGVPVQATLGPSLQLYFKPLVKLKKVTAFDLDDAKQRPLVVEAGYRYITAPNEPEYNRFMPVATFRLPTKGSFLITDRNRADLDWERRHLSVAISKQTYFRESLRDPLLSPDSEFERRALLHKPICKVEYNGSLCRLSIASRKTRAVRSLFRT